LLTLLKIAGERLNAVAGARTVWISVGQTVTRPIIGRSTDRLAIWSPDSCRRVQVPGRSRRRWQDGAWIDQKAIQAPFVELVRWSVGTRSRRLPNAYPHRFPMGNDGRRGTAPGRSDERSSDRMGRIVGWWLHRSPLSADGLSNGWDVGRRSIIPILQSSPTSRRSWRMGADNENVL
jgi:hypothetical protein